MFPTEPFFVAAMAREVLQAASSHFSPQDLRSWMEFRLPQLLLLTETVACVQRHLGPDQSTRVLETLCLAADVLASILASTVHVACFAEGFHPPIVFHPVPTSFRDRVYAEFTPQAWREGATQLRNFLAEALEHVADSENVYAARTGSRKLFHSLLCIFDDTALQLLGLLHEPSTSSFGLP